MISHAIHVIIIHVIIIHVIIVVRIRTGIMNLHMDADFHIVSIIILLASVLEDHVLAVRVAICFGEKLVVAESLAALGFLYSGDVEVIERSGVLCGG